MDQLYEQWLQSQKPGWGEETSSNSVRENGKQIHMPTDYAEEVVSLRALKMTVLLSGCAFSVWTALWCCVKSVQLSFWFHMAQCCSILFYQDGIISCYRKPAVLLCFGLECWLIKICYCLLDNDRTHFIRIFLFICKVIKINSNKFERFRKQMVISPLCKWDPLFFFCFTGWQSLLAVW